MSVSIHFPCHFHDARERDGAPVNLGHLTTFLTVADSGSLTAAAQALFITQPAVSHQIKALEIDLGVKLFVRQKKGMALTAEGEELRAASRNVIRAAEDLSFQVREIKELKRGKVHITLTSALGNALVPGILAFKKEYPLVELRLIFNNTDQVLELTKNSIADIGFASSRDMHHTLLISAPAHRVQLLLLARHDHPLCRKERVRPEDLHGHVFVTREVGTFTRRYTEKWFGTCPLPANTVETTREGSARALIFSGAVGIAPEDSMREEILEGRIRVLPADNLDSWMDCSIYASTARPLSRAARAFLETACRERCLSRTDDVRMWLDSLE